MQLQVPGLKDPLEILDEDFEKTPPAVLQVFMEALTKLAARVAELEEKLNANSRNSSLPPSKDPPGTLRSTKRSSGKSSAVVTVGNELVSLRRCRVGFFPRRFGRQGSLG